MKNIKMVGGFYSESQWREVIGKAELMLRLKLRGSKDFSINWKTHEIVFHNEETGRDWMWYSFHFRRAFSELMEAYHICGGK